MKELCLACIGFVLEFAVFYAVGSLLTRILKMKKDVSLTFILGYLTYFAVFELVTVPMTLKWVSLTTAACIWAGLMIITVIVAIICAVKKKTKDKYSKNLPDAAGISGDITPKKGNRTKIMIYMEKAFDNDHYRRCCSSSAVPDCNLL
jgi:hypothetical protein